MDKDYLIKLTLAVYRVTEVFPEKEPLKFAIREKANGILADLIGKEQKNKVFEQILGNIDVLQGYFEVAQAQKWLKEPNFLVLKREYAKMKQEISKKPLKKQNKPFKQSAEDCPPLIGNERCKKILEVLSQKEKAQTWEIKKIFPEITKRTLRRDLDYLLETGLIQRLGQGNDTFYKLEGTG